MIGRIWRWLHFAPTSHINPADKAFEHPAPDLSLYSLCCEHHTAQRHTACACDPSSGASIGRHRLCQKLPGAAVPNPFVDAPACVKMSLMPASVFMCWIKQLGQRTKLAVLMLACISSSICKFLDQLAQHYQSAELACPLDFIY